MTPQLLRRLERIEASRRPAFVRLTREEREEAARQYEASIEQPDAPDPALQDYLAGRTLHQLAADYDEILRGAPPPWASWTRTGEVR